MIHALIVLVLIGIFLAIIAVFPIDAIIKRVIYIVILGAVLIWLIKNYAAIVGAF